MERDVENLYIQEVGVWLEQLKLRIKSCNTDISMYKQGIEEKKQLIKLNEKQKEIIQKHYNEAVLGFNEWCKDNNYSDYQKELL